MFKNYDIQISLSLGENNELYRYISAECVEELIVDIVVY